MSANLKIDAGKLTIRRSKPPTRFFHYKESGAGEESYIKLLTIGDGIFPKDKISVNITLENSSLVLAGESAAKIYPSDGSICAQSFNFAVGGGSSLEFINDEIILYKNSRHAQFLRVNYSADSSFFISDIFSLGQSKERLSFSLYAGKNTFMDRGKLELYEKFSLRAEEINYYFSRRGETAFAHIFARSSNSGLFENLMAENGYISFEKSSNGSMIKIVLAGESIGGLKSDRDKIWAMFREAGGKKPFDIGKY